MRQKDPRKIAALQTAVIQVLITEGYQNLSVAKIAKLAGISPATLYIYYQDKQDMLSQVDLQIKDHIDTQLFAAHDEQATVAAQFRLLLTNYAHALRLYPKEAAAMRIFNQTPELVAPAAYAQSMARAKPIARLYQQGIATKALRNLAPELLIAFTFQPLDQLAENHFRAATPFTDAEIATAIDMAWAACAQH